MSHPQVVPNLCECLSSAEHKRKYFAEYGLPNSCWALIDLRMYVFIYLFIYLFFPFSCAQQNKEIHTGLEQLEGE